MYFCVSLIVLKRLSKVWRLVGGCRPQIPPPKSAPGSELHLKEEWKESVQVKERRLWNWMISNAAFTQAGSTETRYRTKSMCKSIFVLSRLM